MINKIMTPLIAACLVFLLSSCTSLSEDRMVPDFTNLGYTSSGNTLTVKVMEGVFHYVETGFQHKNLDATMLQNALILSMYRSMIFENVRSAGVSDLELIAEKTKQNWPGTYDGSVRVELAIHYTLKDSRADKILWQKEIPTLGVCTFKEAFNGYTRCNTALERAIRKNFRKCVEKTLAAMP